ncbi:MAG: RcnB family protein [Xanthomonadaceae bacterium]|nr:RcnB family protein [Xanthomonadaceae bacterium]MDE2248815.1 RcnB family protein [Xanthomonadaceae bacterium]
MKKSWGAWLIGGTLLLSCGAVAVAQPVGQDYRGQDNGYQDGQQDGRHDHRNDRRDERRDERNDDERGHWNGHGNDHGNGHGNGRWNGHGNGHAYAYGHDRDHGRHGMYERGRDEGWYRRGGYMPVEYRGGPYVVEDWRRDHLREPPRGYRWVRSDNGDFLLVAITSGIIADLLLHH